MQCQVEFLFFNDFYFGLKKKKLRQERAQEREAVRKMSTFQKPNKLSPKKASLSWLFIRCLSDLHIVISGGTFHCISILSRGCWYHLRILVAMETM